MHKSLIVQVAAIASYLIIKPGAADDTCVVATASTDALLGTAGFTALPTPVGQPLDVDWRVEAKVVYGGNVTRGDWLTSDGQGRAITAAPAAGVNANVIGRALQSGVAGDVRRYMRAPGRIQG